MTQFQKHVVLWGGWYGSRNVGDQALLLTIADILGDTLGDVRYTVFTNDPGHIRSYTSRESSRRFQALDSRGQFLQVVKSLATCDIFIFGGGAPFYEETDHVLAMGLLIGLTRLFRKPYMTWTVSSQVVNKPWVKRFFGWILNGASVITFRDEHTHELFLSCDVTLPMFHTVDSGFCLEPADQASALALISRAGVRDSARSLVGLTPRTLRGRDGDAQTHYNVKTQEEYDREICCFIAAVDWFWENGYQPIFIPMNTVAPDDDRIACRRIINESKHGINALLIDEEVRPRIAPSLYRECKVSFVARVHGSIMSMIGNCPVMMYSFAPKHSGIMNAMGLSDYILEEKSADPEAAVQLLQYLIDNEYDLRRYMDGQLVKLRRDAQIPAILAADILGVHPIIG